ncbi:hypothetical protein [Aquamicrobium ahrensii]|uniref:MEDS domain-containing protein n=1 Tax=Aquamicrobium ahrensii TaxID=469551 RepID=A0ABV2KQ00_9HYPH
MKHQYVGDINDYRKYALLRALSARGANHIGVCWMLTPDDGGVDGGKLAYLGQPDRHRRFDPELFDILAHAAAEPDRRRLQTIEDSGAIAGAAYFNETLSDDAAGRAAFMERCASEFHDAELVFFDPDNCLEVSLPKGRKNSSKYLYLDEVAGFYEAGKSLLIYQHFPRVERSMFMASRLLQLHGVAPDCAVWAFTTAHVVFFLLVHPESPARLSIAAVEACRALDPAFVRGEYHGHGSSPPGY